MGCKKLTSWSPMELCLAARQTRGENGHVQRQIISRDGFKGYRVEDTWEGKNRAPYAISKVATQLQAPTRAYLHVASAVLEGDSDQIDSGLRNLADAPREMLGL